MPLFLWTLLMSLSVALQAAPAAETRYLAGVNQSEWNFAGSRARCELSQEIPEFGTARFLRRAGESLTFSIDSFQPLPEPVEATLLERSPAWVHAEPDTLRQQVTLHKGVHPVRLERKPAAWLLASLARGQMGGFGFNDWDDPRQRVWVGLSPVNFQRPFQAFKRCLKSLPEQGFADFRLSRIHFGLDARKPDADEVERIDRLAAFILADGRIGRIRVEGHADDRGSRRYNLKLSRARAEAVRDRLLAQGVDAGLIRIGYYGESRPRVRSRSEQARARNRRVEVELSLKRGAE